MSKESQPTQSGINRDLAKIYRNNRYRFKIDTPDLSENNKRRLQNRIQKDVAAHKNHKICQKSLHQHNRESTVTWQRYTAITVIVSKSIRS